jgi:hypothetical protein
MTAFFSAMALVATATAPQTIRSVSAADTSIHLLGCGGLDQNDFAGTPCR